VVKKFVALALALAYKNAAYGFPTKFQPFPFTVIG